MGADDHHAWIFVSHASDDLRRVREVRNYLESKGASPLLFHLKALADPEEFWPLIEREISARNFFLYCQSAKAEEREWVRRERAAVEAARKTRAIRVDSIQVDGKELDIERLDGFLSKTRVFPSFARRDRERVSPFLLEMKKAGFQVFEDEELRPAEDWPHALDRELEATARNGWVVVFLSEASLQSEWVNYEIRAGVARGAKLIPVILERIALPAQLAHIQVFDAMLDWHDAPKRLTELMLLR